jgi:hypothetical protein
MHHPFSGKEASKRRAPGAAARHGAFLLKDGGNPRTLAALPDQALIDAVQRQSFRHFRDVDAASGLARGSRTLAGGPIDHKAAIGKSAVSPRQTARQQ